MELEERQLARKNLVLVCKEVRVLQSGTAASEQIFFSSRTGSRDGWTVPELIVTGEMMVFLGKRKRIVGVKKKL